MVILGICGFQGAGKDTFSDYLVKHYGFIKYTFATAIKDIVSILFSWNRKLLEGDTAESRIFRETVDLWWSKKLGITDLTPRKMLQLVGTELFRKHFDSNIWLYSIEKNILNELNSNPNTNIIISDCRFPNEINMLKNFDCKFIHIQRNLPSWFELYKSGIDCIEATKLHESEIIWIRQEFDYTINNVETKELFEKQIILFIKNNFNLGH